MCQVVKISSETYNYNMKKKKKRLSIMTLCLYLFLFACFCSSIFINYFKTKLGPGLIECAENEVNKIMTIVINNCIRKYIDTNPLQNELLKINRNNQNNIELISFDTKKVNQMTSTLTSMLENDLAYMVKGDFDKLNINLNNISKDYYSKINDGIIFSVSFGSATGNSLLANLGPKIPLNLSLVEDVKTSLDTKVTEYGLNNAMIETFIQIQASTIIHMPFLSKKVKVTNKIPITVDLIQGHIPDYYLKNNN